MEIDCDQKFIVDDRNGKSVFDRWVMNQIQKIVIAVEQ